MLDYQEEIKRYELEGKENWRDVGQQLPYISFPAECEVKLIPPFGGALLRFVIRLKEDPTRKVSVYFDQFSRLGCMDYPYWEMYPNQDGDTSRFKQSDTEELITEILLSLKSPIQTN